ncbi:MAG: hypothetical protein ACK5PP_19010 [Acidimicrobiales bacterium]
MSTTFTDDAIAADPESVSWLRSRVVGRFPGRTPVAADIEWRITGYQASQQTHRHLKTIHVEFG